MKDRIRQVMEYAHQSQQDFAATLGISPASLSSIFTGRTNPTNNHVNAIHHVFPEISVNWLMFGEGDMMTSKSGGEADTQPDAEPAVESVSPSHDLFEAQPVVQLPKNAIRPAVDQREARQETYCRPNPMLTAINVDKPARKIREIRVFFDDGTYESFVPSTK